MKLLLKTVLLTALTLGLSYPSKLDLAETDTKLTEDIVCLAKNIYHEARGEPLAGQHAVAQVTLNRTKASGFPSSICAVVYQHKQFSWTVNTHNPIKDWKSWSRSLYIARQAIAGKIPDLENFTALYFHAKHVRPYWKKKRTVYAQIGNHIFY